MEERNDMLAKEATLDLTLVLPAYNEEAKIERDLAQLTAHLDGTGLSYELIVVDDGSSDATASIVARFAKDSRRITLLENKRNRGKGYSVRRGVLAARGRYIGFLDAGLCVPSSEIERALDHLRAGFDIAMGSRKIAGSHIERAQPTYRQVGSKVFRYFMWHIMGLSAIRDTQCGFKFYTREAAWKLYPTVEIDGYMFDIELLRKALRLHMKIKEFPITWSSDPDSHFSFFPDILKNMCELIRIRCMRS